MKRYLYTALLLFSSLSLFSNDKTEEAKRLAIIDANNFLFKTACTTTHTYLAIEEWAPVGAIYNRLYTPLISGSRSELDNQKYMVLNVLGGFKVFLEAKRIHKNKKKSQLIKDPSIYAEHTKKAAKIATLKNIRKSYKSVPAFKNDLQKRLIKPSLLFLESMQEYYSNNQRNFLFTQKAYLEKLGASTQEIEAFTKSHPEVFVEPLSLIIE